ncbi:MAG: creatininase family protein [Gemmatimonadales bacterium]
MGVHYYADLTWKEMGDLLGGEVVAILPVGALEAHGPHLPLATDVIIAEAMAQAGAQVVAAAGKEVVVLPALPYTAAPFAEGFSGTVSLPRATIAQLVADIAAELARQGVSCLALANAHLDPTHLGALADAADLVRAAGTPRMVHPDLTRKPWAGRLTEEFKSGACHAGQYETSVVMAARPELVRDEVRSALPDNPRSLSRAIGEGHRTFEAAGGPEAYFGYPKTATADEGRATIEVLGQILAEAILTDVT